MTPGRPPRCGRSTPRPPAAPCSPPPDPRSAGRATRRRRSTRSRTRPGSPRARSTTTSRARRRCSAPCTRRWRPTRRRARSTPATRKAPPSTRSWPMMDAYLDAALDPEIRRITLIDGPAILGLEPDDAADQQPGHLAMRAFLAASMASGQLIDLDPDVLADLVGGLALRRRAAHRALRRPRRDQGGARAGGRGDAPRPGPGQPAVATARLDTRPPREACLPEPLTPLDEPCPSRIPRVCFIPMESRTLETRLGPRRLAVVRPRADARLLRRRARESLICGATSSPHSKTATAASRSTSRSERTRWPLSAGRRPVGHLAGPAAARLPRPARRRRRHRGRQRHGRRAAPAVAGHRPSGARAGGPPRPDQLRELRPVPAGCAQEGARRCRRAFPWLARSLLRLQLRLIAPAGAKEASPASPRAGWTPSAWHRSPGRCGVTVGWPATSSRPWPVSARSSCSTPPRRSRDSTGRSCWSGARQCGFFPMAHARRLASDFPARDAGLRSRRQDVGPGRQSGRGGRRHRRVRARASAMTARKPARAIS